MGLFRPNQEKIMATIVLGKAPKNFRKLVKVPMLDGTEGTIECIFKYRTSVEYGAFIDSLTSTASAEVPKPEGAPFSLADTLARKRERNGEFMLQILEGWNLDVEFSKDAAQQLCDELPGAADAIFDTYRVAIVEGRLGN